MSRTAAARGAPIDLLDTKLFQARREHAAFDALRAGPGLHFNPEPDGPGFFALVRHDHVAEAASDTGLFSSAKGTQIRDKRAEGEGPASVHNCDPPLHSALRAIGVRGLRRELIEQRLPRFRRIIAGLIEAAPRGAFFDFVEAIAVKIPMMVFADMLGVPDGDQMRMVGWANAMSDVLASDAEQAAARAELFEYFRALAAKRRADPQADIASALVHAELDGAPLSQGQLDAFFILFVVAGNETTRNLMSGGLEQLCLQQDDLARLRDDRALIGPCVEEMVRWVTPVIQMRRTVTRDAVAFGQPMRRGDKVVLYFAAANRDPAAFDAPHQFVIDRAPNRHVGFGHGAHFCLGAHLARIETAMFLEETLKRFARIEIAAPGERLASNWFAGTARLDVRWS